MKRPTGTRKSYTVDAQMERFQRRRAIGSVAWRASLRGPSAQRQARFEMLRLLLTAEADKLDLTTEQVRQLDPAEVVRRMAVEVGG